PAALVRLAREDGRRPGRAAPAAGRGQPGLVRRHEGRHPADRQSVAGRQHEVQPDRAHRRGARRDRRLFPRRAGVIEVMIAALLALLLAQQKPAYPAGSSDVTFDSSPELCDVDEVKARFRASDKIPPYDVKNEKFKLVVPKTYAPAAKWGLFVYVNAGDDPGLPAEYEPVLEKRKLIAVAPYKAGNGRNIFDRFRLAVDAAFTLQKKMALDPARIYVSGFSGGARTASMLAVAYADLFSGA